MTPGSLFIPPPSRQVEALIFTAQTRASQTLLRPLNNRLVKSNMLQNQWWKCAMVNVSDSFFKASFTTHFHRIEYCSGKVGWPGYKSIYKYFDYLQMNKKNIPNSINPALNLDTSMITSWYPGTPNGYPSERIAFLALEKSEVLPLKGSLSYGIYCIFRAINSDKASLSKTRLKMRSV